MANIFDTLDLESAEALLEQDKKANTTEKPQKDDRERSSSRHGKKRKHRSKSRSGSRKKKHRKRSKDRSRSGSKKRKHSRDRKHKKDREKSKSKSKLREIATVPEPEEVKPVEIEEKDDDSKLDNEEKRRRQLKVIEQQLEEARKLADEAKRDDATVLILQLSLKTSEFDVYNFFQKGNCGRTRDIRIIKDPRSGKSKGVAYVEFYSQESVLKAIAMNGREINGHVVKIQPSQAEKNRAAAAAKSYRQMRQTKNVGDSQQPGALSMRIYVQGLTDSLSNIQAQDLRELFSPFGDIDFVDLPSDPNTGSCRGYAFIQYRNPDDARAAIRKMNNFTLGDKTIKVSNVQPGMAHLSSESHNLDLDDESGNNYLHNAQSRALLMQKLTRENDPSNASAGNPGINLGMNTNNPLMNPSMYAYGAGAGLVATEDVNRPPESPYPTPYLLLPKMFDPTQVNLAEDPGFYVDLREDVEVECRTYGAIEYVFIEQSDRGNIWVAFKDPKSAENAKNSLSKRFFQGQRLNPYYISQATFNEMTMQK